MPTASSHVRPRSLARPRAAHAAGLDGREGLARGAVNDPIDAKYHDDAVFRTASWFSETLLQCRHRDVAHYVTRLGA